MQPKVRKNPNYSLRDLMQMSHCRENNLYVLNVYLGVPVFKLDNPVILYAYILTMVRYFLTPFITASQDRSTCSMDQVTTAHEYAEPLNLLNYRWWFLGVQHRLDVGILDTGLLFIGAFRYVVTKGTSSVQSISMFYRTDLFDFVNNLVKRFSSGG